MFAQLNNIVIEGTAVSEPAITGKDADTDKDIVSFTIANDKYYRNVHGDMKQKTVFIKLQSEDELGRRVLETIKKGMVIRAVGELVPVRWKNERDEKMQAIEILCNHIEIPKERKI